MRGFTRQVMSPVFAVSVMAALVGACNSESSTEPETMSAPQQATGATQASRRGPIDLGQCDSLAVSGRSQLLAHYYAVGDQIYFWDGTGWLFIGPDATLYAGKAMRVKVGVHQVAGVWESRDGSKVVGQVQRSCTPTSSDISWQRLTALGHDGRGIFAKVDLIQRIRTQGGIAPTAPGTQYGEQQRVPYQAEYLFYNRH